MRVSLLCFGLITSLSLLGGGGPFRKLSFEKALEEAKTQKKVVFVDFYTTWCAPCKILDRTTWKDEQVLDWLEKHTIPLKIDAERQVALSRKYRITAYPTLILIKPDGSEMDRITGYRPPEEFIKEAQGILEGKDPLASHRKSLEGKGQDNPMLRLEYADKLAQMGKREEALKEYLWCYDHGGKSPSFAGVRNSFLLSRITRLGRTWPPAIKALEQRRDPLGARVARGDASWKEVADLASLNRALGEDNANLAIYDRLVKEKTDSPAIGFLYDSVYPQLLEARRYKDIAEGREVSVTVARIFERYNSFLKYLDQLPPAQKEEMKANQILYLLDSLGQSYQVLLGLDRFEEAGELAGRVLEFHGGPEAYNALAWHGFLSGKRLALHLEQARKAFRLSKGEDPHIIDTVAHLLAALDRKPEGVALVEEYLPKFRDPYERGILTRCLADLKSR